MEAFLVDWLLSFISEDLDLNQFGGRKGVSTVHYLLNFLDFIHSNLDKSSPHAVLGVLIDLSKAFNRVDHSILIEDLFLMKCPSWLLKIIISYLTKRSLIVSFEGSFSCPKELYSGSPAGCLLGGVLFIVKFNGALLRPPIKRPLSNVKNISLKYFDDATSAVGIDLKEELSLDPVDRPRPLTSNERSGLILPIQHNKLQDDLDGFRQFAQENNFQINHQKTKVISFNPSFKYLFPPELYVSHSEYLEVVRSANILGLRISDDLRWNENTDFIVSKAMKRLWTLRRLRKLGFDNSFILDVYTKEIRSVLEYAVPIWHGALTAKDSEKIERVQKIVLKFLLRHKYSSYTEACKEFGISKLAQRREKLCLKFALKEYKKSSSIFMKVPRSDKRPPRRVAKKNVVIVPKSRTQRHQRSCFVYLSKLLNEYHNG